jgi:hypothetical protein
LVGEDGLLLDGERSLLVGDDGLRFGDGALLNGEVALAVGEGILIGDDTGCGFTMRIGLLGDNVRSLTTQTTVVTNQKRSFTSSSRSSTFNPT